ncbi:MAG: uroporphyrinogen-III synthase [Cocleimonas sp.]|nr:uroporphyrinogen-III synthase [Cocleimonas sp.]
MSNQLKNRWIAITRPAHQAGQLITKLESKGAKIIPFPLLEIVEPTSLSVLQQQLSQLEHFNTAIFISSNAVESALARVNKAQLKSLKIAAVGKKTALSLRNKGLTVDYFPDKRFNSEALLALDALQAVQGQRIIIFRGEGGRDLLRDTLRQRGACVTYSNVYARRCPADNIALLKQHYDQQQLDIIVITSGESLQHLLRLADNDEWLANVPLLVGSQRIKQQFQPQFSGNIWVAPDPSDETIYSYLQTRMDSYR